MKKSLRILSALVATLLLSGLLATAAAAATPTLPTTPGNTGLSSWDVYVLSNLNGRVLLPNGNYQLPNGQILTPQQVSDLYAQYYGHMGGLPIIPPTTGAPSVTPGINNVIRSEMTLVQYQSTRVGFGTGFIYSSTNPSVVTVDENGIIFARSAGEGRIAVSNGYYLVAIIDVTVTSLTVTPPTVTLDLTLNIGSSYITVGETTILYPEISVSGNPYYTPNVELVYSVSDPTVLHYDTTTKLVTGLAAGTATITVSIKDTEITRSVTVRVLAPTGSTTPSNPSNPGYWNPGYWNPGYYPGYAISGVTFMADGRIMIDPAASSLGSFGFTPEMLKYYFGIDANNYTTQYKMSYVNGEYRRLIVLTPKATIPVPDGGNTGTGTGTGTGSGTGTGTTPSTPPTVTPEQLEELKRQEELKANIQLALSGKMSWFDVYNDIWTPNNYSAGIEFVLSNQYMTGKDTGAFGAYDKMTYGDVMNAIKAYAKDNNLNVGNIQVSGKEGDLITRQEMMSIFYSLAKQLELDTSARTNTGRFQDKGDLKSAYADAFSWAIANNLVITTSKKMSPNLTVTKSVLAQVLYRFDKMMG